MNPDAFFAADSERQAQGSPFLIRHLGLHVRELTIDEAQGCLRDGHQFTIIPNGHCHLCGCRVHSSRALYCRPCKRKRDTERQREYVVLYPRRRDKPRTHACPICGTPITATATVCRPCHCRAMVKKRYQ